MCLLAFLFAVLLLPVCALGQPAGGIAVREVDANAVDAITNLSIVDGRLYFCSSQLLYSAAITPEGIDIPEVDVAMMSIDPEMNYVVRHPLTRELFYTKCDASGRSRLYVFDAVKHKCRPVRIGRFADDVVHPVFSESGDIMVFSSDCSIGFGGYDLWYSRLENGRWQDPQNMGRRINSAGDEIAPHIAWGLLYFASDGFAQENEQSHYVLFASCLVPQKTIFGDTVCSFPIGRGTVQRLQSPFDGKNHQMYFVLDSMGERGFWVNRALGADSSCSLLAFLGRPDCVRLKGNVNALSSTPARTQIAVNRMNAGGGSSSMLSAWTSATDDSGHYELLLPPGGRYAITFSHPDCFASTLDFVAVRGSNAQLYEDQRLDVSLAGFALDHTLSFSNDDPNEAFFLEASADLTEVGRSLLDQVVLFLQQNEHIRLSVTLVQRSTNADEQTFCSLLNESRIGVIRNYFLSHKLGLARVADIRFDSDSVVGEVAVSGTALLFEK